MFEKKTKGQTI